MQDRQAVRKQEELAGGRFNTAGSAVRLEGLVSAEHVPDRDRQLAGDVDLGHLGAALFAELALVSLVALGVGGMAQRVCIVASSSAQRR
jgi:hypothetical protein